MRNKILGVSLILLSMGIGSCGLWGGEDPDIDSSSETSSEEQSFPIASPEKSSPSAAKVSLTRPTDPNERLRVIKSGRNDPFAAIVPTVFPDNSSPRSTPSNPRSTPSNSAGGQTSPASSSSGSQNSALNIKRPKPGSSTQPSNFKPASAKPSAALTQPGVSAVPTVPKPEIAQGVKVTGVINMGNRPQAIIKAPGEKATRAVGVGERIANGQVLVKAINMSTSAAPIVVLEQSGMEVRLSVGQEPVTLAAAPEKSKK